MPDSELGTVIEGANAVWNGETDEVRLYKDGDTLKFRRVDLGDAETW